MDVEHLGRIFEHQDRLEKQATKIGEQSAETFF